MIRDAPAIDADDATSNDRVVWVKRVDKPEAAWKSVNPHQAWGRQGAMYDFWEFASRCGFCYFSLYQDGPESRPRETAVAIPLLTQEFLLSAFRKAEEQELCALVLKHAKPGTEIPIRVSFMGRNGAGVGSLARYLEGEGLQAVVSRHQVGPLGVLRELWDLPKDLELVRSLSLRVDHRKDAEAWCRTTAGSRKPGEWSQKTMASLSPHARYFLMLANAAGACLVSLWDSKSLTLRRDYLTPWATRLPLGTPIQPDLSRFKSQHHWIPLLKEMRNRMGDLPRCHVSFFTASGESVDLVRDRGCVVQSGQFYLLWQRLKDLGCHFACHLRIDDAAAVDAAVDMVVAGAAAATPAAVVYARTIYVRVTLGTQAGAWERCTTQNIGPLGAHVIDVANRRGFCLASVWPSGNLKRLDYLMPWASAEPSQYPSHEPPLIPLDSGSTAELMAALREHGEPRQTSVVLFSPTGASIRVEAGRSGAQRHTCRLNVLVERLDGLDCPFARRLRLRCAKTPNDAAARAQVLIAPPSPPSNRSRPRLRPQPRVGVFLPPEEDLPLAPDADMEETFRHAERERAMGQAARRLGFRWGSIGEFKRTFSAAASAWRPPTPASINNALNDCRVLQNHQGPLVIPEGASVTFPPTDAHYAQSVRWSDPSDGTQWVLWDTSGVTSVNGMTVSEFRQVLQVTGGKAVAAVAAAVQPQPQPPSKTEKPTPMAGIKGAKSRKADSDAQSCVACLEHQKTVLLMPCKHLCLCPECARALMKPPHCPMCRQRIESTMVVFS